jgi:ABC-2 type transport system ATP-binding protein
MCLGLLHPTSGGVRVLGQTVVPGDTKALRAVGSLVGTPGMLPHLSARRNLRLLARLHPGVDAPRVEEVLELVGLRAAADRAVWRPTCPPL